MLIMNWRCGASEVVDLVHLHIEWERDVVAYEFETRMPREVVNIAFGARKEIIETNNVVAFAKKAIA
jgi:hypothetical protein